MLQRNYCLARRQLVRSGALIPNPTPARVRMHARVNSFYTLFYSLLSLFTCNLCCLVIAFTAYTSNIIYLGISFQKKAFLDSFPDFDSDIFICQKNVRFTKPVFEFVKKCDCDGYALKCKKKLFR